MKKTKTIDYVHAIIGRQTLCGIKVPLFAKKGISLFGPKCPACESAAKQLK